MKILDIFSKIYEGTWDNFRLYFNIQRIFSWKFSSEISGFPAAFPVSEEALDVFFRERADFSSFFSACLVVFGNLMGSKKTYLGPIFGGVLVFFFSELSGVTPT